MIFAVIISHSMSCGPYFVSWTPTKVGEEFTVQTHKARRVLLFGKAVDLDHVHLGAVLGIGEGDLVVEIALRGEEPLWLEVRVELLDDGKRRAQDVIGDVSHRHVVRQPYLLPYALESAAPGDGQHPDGEGAAKAESRAPRRKPEFDLALITKQIQGSLKCLILLCGVAE